MTKQRLLIYGAGGRTGQSIARHARNRGLDIVLAGRSSGALAALAQSLGCEMRIADIEDEKALAAMLRDVAVVINSAGPFETTASPIVEACINSHCHYLDVNGELRAYRDVADSGGDAEDAGVLLMPGAGFCVIASTFLLAGLLRGPDAKPSMREPSRARIAFSGGPASSVGSIKSLYASLYPGVEIVRDGDVVSVPIGSLERTFDFEDAGGIRVPDCRRGCTAISVADTFAALCDTPSLGQIETYVEGSLAMRTFFEGSGRFTGYSKVQPWKALVERSMRWWPATPDSGVDTRAAVCVEVDNPWLETRRSVHRTPSTYGFTAVAVCAIAELVLAGVGFKPGFQTPVAAFGHHPALRPAFDLKAPTAGRRGRRAAAWSSGGE
jgi:short subunit dehydrogenase-like uncharacterized protein